MEGLSLGRPHPLAGAAEPSVVASAGPPVENSPSAVDASLSTRRAVRTPQPRARPHHEGVQPQPPSDTGAHKDEDDQFAFLFLFSGPAGRPDGVDHWCRQSRVRPVMFDLFVGGRDHDLLDDLVFSKFLARIKGGEFAAGFVATPCEIFSAVRSRQHGETCGPVALRAARGKERYGFDGLSAEDRELCKRGTLLAQRSADVIKTFSNLKIPWALESPWRFDRDSPFVFWLDELVDIQSSYSPVWCRTDQCRDGADCIKPTAIWSSIPAVRSFGKLCDHPAQWWRYPD